MATKVSLPAPTSNTEPKEFGLSTIREVSREFGLTLRALRYYEHRGLLNPVRIESSRLYDDAQKLRLQMIVKCKQLGFTLSEIADLLETAIDEDALDLQLDKDTILTQLRHMEQRRSEIDLAIAELQASLRRFPTKKNKTGHLIGQAANQIHMRRRSARPQAGLVGPACGQASRGKAIPLSGLPQARCEIASQVNDFVIGGARIRCLVAGRACLSGAGGGGHLPSMIG